MARLSDVEEHRRTLNDLVTLAQRDLLTLWRSLDLSDAAATSAALKAALPDLVAAYGAVAATLAADFYEGLREQAAVRAAHSTVLADPPTRERVEALAGWGTAPLFAAAPDTAKALTLLAGGLQRAVAGADRETVEANVAADPGSPVYARHASANACAFCAMLASRSAVYSSGAAAVSVVGRGAEKVPGQDYGTDRLGRRRSTRNTPQGIRARGSRGMGEKYHDGCHCIAVPVWPGQEVPRAPYAEKWDKAYADATKATTASGEPIDLSKVLAHMRGSLDTN